MNKSPFFSVTALAMVTGLLAAPSLAQASSAWHQDNGDIVRFTPEHINSKTRTQVINELDTARADGTLSFIQRSVAVPTKSFPEPKTRQQVINDMLNQSLEQRRAQSELYNG